MAGLSIFQKRCLYVGLGYFVWVVLFWFLGADTHMSKFTAFFGLAGITLVYAGLVYIYTKIKGD